MQSVLAPVAVTTTHLEARLEALMHGLSLGGRAVTELRARRAALGLEVERHTELVARVCAQDVAIGFRARDRPDVASKTFEHVQACDAEAATTLDAHPSSRTLTASRQEWREVLEYTCPQAWQSALALLHAYSADSALAWLAARWSVLSETTEAVHLEIDTEGRLAGACTLWLRCSDLTGIDALFEQTQSTRRYARLLLDTFFRLGAARQTPRELCVGLRFARGFAAPDLRLRLDTRARPESEIAARDALDRLLDVLVPRQRARLRAHLQAAPSEVCITDVGREGCEVELCFGAREMQVAANAATASPRSTLHAAIRAGVAFLSTHCQRGCFRDYLLPAGWADAWVSAYVARQLQAVALRTAELPIAPLLASSLAWLSARRTRAGGWGYNAATLDDADSTALGVLALRHAGRDAPEGSLELLRSCLREDGGVGTYPRRDAEGHAQSVVDVTPTALAALQPMLSELERARSQAFLRRSQAASGLWLGYWWLSPLYATLHAVEYFAAEGLGIPRQAELLASLASFRTNGAFEGALLLRTLQLCGDPSSARAVASELLHEQLSDGSWPASAFMRVTQPWVLPELSVVDAGPVYEDRQRVFTTASVVAALSCVLEL